MQTLFEEYPMLLLGLEAGIALFLLIFIVWWTMSGARKGPQRPLRAPTPESPSAVDRAAEAAPQTLPSPDATDTASTKAGRTMR